MKRGLLLQPVGLVLALAFVGAPAWADGSLPAYVKLPAGIEVPSGSLSVEDFGEASFSLAEGKSVIQQGKHYRSYLAFSSGTNPGAAATWKLFQPGLTAAGFKPIGNDSATTYTLKREAGGVVTWLSLGLADYNDPLLEIIEVKAQATALALPPPAAQPERYGDGDDFPFLLHPAGATLQQTAKHDEPLELSLPGSEEPLLVGHGYLIKYYAAPSTLSRLEFAQTYRDALAKAGWTVVPMTPGSRPGEGPVVASYAKNGRSLWVSLRRGDPTSDEGVLMTVADVGAEDWAKQLDRDCHLPLYGVHFDFNQATLRPDSEPVLRKALALLQGQPKLAVEVQGHTDSVGSDAANLTLSDARARAVRQWLADHGIPAERLTAKGYGKKVPVESNDTDEGRARNRRVEVAKPGCGTAGTSPAATGRSSA